MGRTSQTVADGQPALAALRASVDRAQAGSPLSPVTVVVPSNSVGVAARRWLAAHGGVSAAQFVTVFRLAELLGAPALVAAGRRPVSTPVVDVAVRRALRSAPGMFAPVATHPATVAALRDTYRELRHLTEAQLHLLGTAGSARARDVVRVHRRVERHLTGGWYDEADLLRTAQARCGGRVVPVVVFLPGRLRPTEDALLQALALDADVHEIVSAGVLGGPSDSPDLPAEPVDVVDLSDADDEVREAVRHIVAATLRGTPLERIAVVWPLADPYARLITDHLDAAGIPWNGRPGTVLHERLAARILLDVLALDRRGIRRAELFAVLAHAPARHADGRRVSSQQWERVSRAAGLAGDDDWGDRLAHFRRDAALDPRRGHDALAAAELSEFVDDLRTTLGPPGDARPWRHWSELCMTLLNRWLGGPRRIALLPPVEHAAFGEVQAVVDRLGRLDEIDGPITRASFVEALATEFDGSPRRVGRIGDGVQVGPLSYAIGQTLDLIVVLGASEGQLPTPPTRDALLGDADRALTGGALELSDAVAARQRNEFAAAIAAARRVVVTLPRGDLRATAVRQPSRWLADLATTVAIHRRSVASFAAGLADASFPATLGQHRIRALAHHVRSGSPFDEHPLAGSVPALRSGLAMLRAREGATFTAFDGDLSGAGVASPFAAGAAMSPTRLELWASCPFAYFMHHVLRLQPVEQPEAALRISPLDQGSLVHEALDRFHRLVLDGTLPQPGPSGWGDDHLAALLAEFDHVADQVAASGRVGRIAFWTAGRVKLVNDLRAWMATDGARLADRRAQILRSEYSFGLGPDDPQSGAAAEIVIGHADGPNAAGGHQAGTPTGTRTVLLRGKVDRIDVGADGALYVTDHKTGSARNFRTIVDDDPTAGGTKLQLPAYAAAARALGVDGARIHAEFSFIGAAHPTRIGVDFGEATWSIIGDQLTHIVHGVESALFHQVPERSQFRLSWVACPYCDPDGLGTVERYEEFARKSGPHGDARVATIALATGSTASTDDGGS